MESAK